MREGLPVVKGLPTWDDQVDSRVAAAKLETLRHLLAQKVRAGALVAFSGGVDSAFLLWAAEETRKESGGSLVALTTTSPSTPSGDKADAQAFSGRMGVEHVWEESRELSDPAYIRNDRERCYHCKTELFRIAGELASERDLSWILYGYNASDQADDRPGHRAAQEAGALAPLSEVGLTKAEIRHLMAEAGLPLSTKPASPCLSSRIMTGVEVTPERLRDVERMEDVLRAAAISTFRVRICEDGEGSNFIRIEVAPQEMEAVLACRDKLLDTGAAGGYRWVTLDLGGYRMGGGVL